MDKFAERRAELAEAALQTLSELGYARTSLREIAQNSEFTHGVLHYYFRDKVDLILCSVRQYKARCVTRYDQVTADARTYEDLMTGFLAALAQTMRDEAHMHRLWYDIRSQTLFETAFRADVAELDKSLENMIWRIMCRFAELTGEPQTHAALGDLCDDRRTVSAMPAETPFRRYPRHRSDAGRREAGALEDHERSSQIGWGHWFAWSWGEGTPTRMSREKSGD